MARRGKAGIWLGVCIKSCSNMLFYDTHVKLASNKIVTVVNYHKDNRSSCFGVLSQSRSCNQLIIFQSLP